MDDGPTSYFLGIEVVRDMEGGVLEVHQQKYIRKTLLTFDEFLPKSKKNGEELVLMHYTPTIHPSSFQNMSHVDEPVSAEDKELMSKLPFASVIGHLLYLNTADGLIWPMSCPN